MTDNNKKSKTNSINKTQGKSKQVSLSKAEIDLIDAIVKEAKLLATQQTSSAFGIITKTRELLRIEEMQRP